MSAANGWIVEQANLLLSGGADSRRQSRFFQPGEQPRGLLLLRARVGDDDPRLLFEVVAVAGEQQRLARELFGLRRIAFLQMATRQFDPQRRAVGLNADRALENLNRFRQIARGRGTLRFVLQRKRDGRLRLRLRLLGCTGAGDCGIGCGDGLGRCGYAIAADGSASWRRPGAGVRGYGVCCSLTQPANTTTTPTSISARSNVRLSR